MLFMSGLLLVALLVLLVILIQRRTAEVDARPQEIAKDVQDIDDRLESASLESVACGYPPEGGVCKFGWQLNEHGCCTLDEDHYATLSSEELKREFRKMLITEFGLLVGEELAEKLYKSPRFRRLVKDGARKAAQGGKIAAKSIRNVVSSLRAGMRSAASRSPKLASRLASVGGSKLGPRVASRLGLKTAREAVKRAAKQAAAKIGAKAGAMAAKIGVKAGAMAAKMAASTAALSTGPIGMAWMAFDMASLALDLWDPAGLGRDHFNTQFADERDFAEAYSALEGWMAVGYDHPLPFLEADTLVDKALLEQVQDRCQTEYSIQTMLLSFEAAMNNDGNITQGDVEATLDDDDLFNRIMYEEIKKTPLSMYVQVTKYGLSLTSYGVREHNTRVVRLNSQLKREGKEDEMRPLVAYTNVYRVPLEVDIESTSDITMEERRLDEPMAMILDYSTRAYDRYVYCKSTASGGFGYKDALTWLSRTTPVGALVTFKPVYPGDYGRTFWDENTQLCSFASDFCKDMGMQYKRNPALKVGDCKNYKGHKVGEYIVGKNVTKSVTKNVMKAVDFSNDAGKFVLGLFKKRKQCAASDIPHLYVGCIANESRDAGNHLMTRNKGCQYPTGCRQIALDNDSQFWGMLNPDSCGPGRSICYIADDVYSLNYGEQIKEANSCDCKTDNASPGLGSAWNMSAYVVDDTRIGEY